MHAAEVIAGSEASRVLLTCEHASNALPEPWRWPEPDRWIIDTHWAIDLGAAEVTRHLAQAMHAPAVLATFSRLLVDPNRPVPHPELFRKQADGHTVWLNHDLTHREQEARVEHFHSGYHAVVDQQLARTPRAMILSIHTFTPIYEAGPPRPMEIGVLFDRDESLALQIADALHHEGGWKVALNEPYSGRNGLMYAPDRHAMHHGRPAVEFEIRQDIANDPTRHADLVRSIRHALTVVGRTLPPGTGD